MREDWKRSETRGRCASLGSVLRNRRDAHRPTIRRGYCIARPSHFFGLRALHPMSADRPLSKVTRQELYDLVWSTPGSKLSADFGVSDVAIAKRCGKLGVPRP